MSRVNRRQFIAVGLPLWAGAGAAQPVAPPRLPAAVSLAEELRAALATGQPLVALVSLDGCPHCKLVRENYLAPLREREGLPVVQLDMGSARAVKDFAGADRTHEDLIRAWNVRLAPTVLFFGADGVEIVSRLRGMGLPDFYGAYLEERLQQAGRKLRR